MRRLPAEWEPQSAIMLTWPHEQTDWRDDLERVHALWAGLTTTIGRYEPVLLVGHDPEHAELARSMALAAGARPERLWLASAPSDDSWARDHGPITVLDGDTPILVDFGFNGWGRKYPHARDDAINRHLHAAGVLGDRPMEPGGIVLEGGAIESDGAGTLLAVERTVRDPMRNPGLGLGAIEAILAERLGIRHFLWLANGRISGDDTDGHIDTLARFCDPRTICYLRCDDPSDPDFPGLQAMESELRGLRDPGGRPYRLIPLPSPAPVIETGGTHRGERLPAGYANFLILNGAVLVPTYADPADARAMGIIGRLFPGREVIGLDCRPLIRRGGSLHCVTMQLPGQMLVHREASSPGQIAEPKNRRLHR